MSFIFYRNVGICASCYSEHCVWFPCAIKDLHPLTLRHNSGLVGGDFDGKLNRNPGTNTDAESGGKNP